MKRNDRTSIVLAFSASLTVLSFGCGRPTSSVTACQANLKSSWQALRIYAEDWDGWAPPVAWQASLRNYAADPTALGCPYAPRVAVGALGFAFYRPILAHQLYKFDQNTTAVLFDSMELRLNASSLLDLPSVARHSEGNNICYLDGHIQAKQ